jgi:hypothetical protein
MPSMRIYGGKEASWGQQFQAALTRNSQVKPAWIEDAA